MVVTYEATCREAQEAHFSVIHDFWWIVFTTFEINLWLWMEFHVIFTEICAFGEIPWLFDTILWLSVKFKIMLKQVIWIRNYYSWLLMDCFYNIWNKFMTLDGISCHFYRNLWLLVKFHDILTQFYDFLWNLKSCWNRSYGFVIIMLIGDNLYVINPFWICVQSKQRPICKYFKNQPLHS